MLAGLAKTFFANSLPQSVLQIHSVEKDCIAVKVSSSVVSDWVRTYREQLSLRL